MKNLRAIALAAFPLAVLAVPAAADAVQPSAKRVCGRYSSFTLLPTDKVRPMGAGHSSVSMLVSGARGNWIYYDGLIDEGEAEKAGTLVYNEGGVRAYRRSNTAKAYVLVSDKAARVDGKVPFVTISGVEFNMADLENSAIKGTNADLALLPLIQPGVTTSCHIRWKPGTGLVDGENDVDTGRPTPSE